MIPRFGFHRHTICLDSGEAAGYSLTMEWLGFVVELVLARKLRVVSPPADSEEPRWLRNLARRYWRAVRDESCIYGSPDCPEQLCDQCAQDRA